MTKQNTDHDLRVRAVACLQSCTTVRMTPIWRRIMVLAIANVGLFVPAHVAAPIVDDELLADEFHEWAELLADPTAHGELFKRARKAAGLTSLQTVAQFALWAAKAYDTEPGNPYQVMGLCRLEDIETGSAWPTLDKIKILAELYDVRPEYLAGYPLEAPNELVAKLGDKHTDADLAKLIELARMIGGYAPSAQ